MPKNNVRNEEREAGDGKTIDRKNNHKLSSPQETIKVLKKHGLSLDKQYGQNFLVDENILRKIIESSAITDKDIILEVGGGIGTLSLPLSIQASFVHILELDRDLVDPLNSVLGQKNNYKIYNVDAMKMDCKSIKPKPNKVVANLPYNIAAPLLVKLLSECASIDEYYVMVQKEMAERFTAPVGSANYSSLSVKIQLLADIRKLFAISPNSFMPKPKVSSVFINLKKLDFDFRYKETLWGIIKVGFNYRRKKLINALSLSGGFDNQKILHALEASGISAGQRAQELTKEDFIRLARAYAEG